MIKLRLLVTFLGAFRKMFRTRIIFGGTMDNYISMENWKFIALVSAREPSNLKLSMFALLYYPHPCYFLHQNKLYYIDSTL